MKRLLIVIATTCAALAAPAASQAAIQELGVVPASATPTVTQSLPSCPGTPCLAVSRTTGYQAKVGTTRAPFVVPTAGRIVAWTITLGAPKSSQITFFNTNEGGPASAAIAVLAPGKSLNYSLVAQSPTMLLAPYFGGSVQFPLATTLPVTKGDVIALTVPTWAPRWRSATPVTRHGGPAGPRTSARRRTPRPRWPRSARPFSSIACTRRRA